MKYLVFCFFVLATVVACYPCRHFVSSSQDSVRIETVVRTEYLSDTVFVEVPVENEYQTVKDTTSHLETSFAVSDARINADGSLFHSLANRLRKYPVTTEKEVVYRDSIVYRGRADTEVIEVERELTWWQQTQIKGFWVELIVLMVVCRRKIFP